MLDRRALLLGLGSILTMYSRAGRAGSTSEGTAAPAHLYPYHPLLYQLDLCVLSYQLYGQTLIWPFDPYYESAPNRKKMLAKAQAWAVDASAVATGPELERLRGPGVLSGFGGSAKHDPIIYRYSMVDPRRSCLNRPTDQWVFYNTPDVITDRLKSVHVAFQKMSPEGSAKVSVLQAIEYDNDDATDILYSFEGGTGGKEVGDLLSRSLLGFVLKRVHAQGYDLHICFRGSRSGSAARAARQAFRDRQEKGNPDWITDLGCNRVTEPITSGGESNGSVSRGFATSMNDLFPCLTACLSEIASASRADDGSPIPPTHITVTGHSLGGALAQHFVSAIRIGTMNFTDPVVDSWPWAQTKLVTFSAPRAGDKEWASELSSQLESVYWQAPLRARNKDALPPQDASIIEDLTQKESPAAFRVLISRDPITSEKTSASAGSTWGRRSTSTTTLLLSQRKASARTNPWNFGAICSLPFQTRPLHEVCGFT